MIVELILLIVLLPSGEQEVGLVPTAERVFRIFHGDGTPTSLESPSDVEELLEIDFTDLGRIMNEVEGLEGAAAVSLKKTTSVGAENAEGQATITTVEERFKGVCVDTKLPPLQRSQLPTNPILAENCDTRTLDEDMNEDDEIIVYVAPHPRNGKLAPCSIQSPSAAVASHPPSAGSGPVSGTYGPPHVTTSTAEPVLQCNPTPSPHIPSPPLNASSSIISGPSEPAPRAQGPRRTSNRRMNRYATFGSFGAIRAEVALREVDPRRDEQRHGDSDVDWGSSTSQENADDGGMLVDQDVDVYAMEAFVRGMSTSGIAHISADDLEDEARIRAEEENEEKGDGECRTESDDSADDTEFELAGDGRDVLIPIDGSELTFGNALVEDEDESSSDEEETPKRSFQARLERLRKQVKGRPIEDMLEDELDQELEADEEDSIIAKIQVTGSFDVLPTTEVSIAGLP
jgi:hypothetical protein